MQKFKESLPRTWYQRKPCTSQQFQSLVKLQQSELKEFISVGNQINRPRTSPACAQSEYARFAEMGQFSTMIVHEVRNPLTTILMSLQSFQNLNLPEIFQRRLDFALDEAERLQRLVNEILLYTKPQTLVASPIDLNTLIMSCLKGFQAQPSARGKKLTFRPPDYPVEVLGSTDKLKQVLINLLTNACEASNPGEEIALQLQPGELGVLSVCLTVHNWGQPIPADQLATVLQPFYSTKASGNGLGLPIVKSIAEEHGGHLRISSDSKSGTTVAVELPTKPQ